jgi:hypothetical protein
MASDQLCWKYKTLIPDSFSLIPEKCEPVVNDRETTETWTITVAREIDDGGDYPFIEQNIGVSNTEITRFMSGLLHVPVVTFQVRYIWKWIINSVINVWWIEMHNLGREKWIKR